MKQMIKHLVFWFFQIVNTITALFMTFLPGPFHESLFRNPKDVYAKLGFSELAVEMLHNVIRGHGAILLAVSIFIWIERWKSRSVFLLISFVCGLSAYAHIMTLRQHLQSAEIVDAIGNFRSLSIMIAATAVIGLMSLAVYLKWGNTADRR